ncbi:hypothetical protein U9M48_008516 [Paspalum notatum var. saurae]|uniref:Reverse transcriptase Ty1/copia-type domain-containing protein n=1 Tax=Paspalum notatum var. saurae TaxID=547442 RepID=A0AAQ3WDJ1_PASNO
MDKFESDCLDGNFLGYASSSRAFRVWILEAKQVVETCEVSFDETMPCTTPAFELSGDDEKGAPIFEDEEAAVPDGDEGAPAPAAAPAPSATSSNDEGGPLSMASSSLPQQQAQAEAGPAEDAGEVTSEIVPSRQVLWDYPPHTIIGDLHQRVNAMHKELENFERNHVWDLVKPPPNCRPIGTKWVFKNKHGENGMVRDWYPRVYHKEGIDYEETFDPLTRLEAIKILLAFAGSKGFKLQQMDVKLAFLKGYIEEEVYVRQPPSFESAKFPDRVYKLRKALYGLKQAPRAWYARSKSFLLKSRFVMGSVDKTLFLLSCGGDTLLVQIYVHDIIFGGSSHTLVSKFAEQMSSEFEMSLMGELQFFLGLWRGGGPEGILRDNRLTFVPDGDQTGHSVCGLPLCTFRYLKFTPELGLWYSLGTSLVSWSSRKQASVSLSTTEAEYIAAASCCSQLLWMKATLSDFSLSFGRIPLLMDSTSAISVAKNPVLHSRTKHIDVRFHFLRDYYEKGDIDLIHVEGVDNALIKEEIESQWTGLIALLV